MQKSIIVILLIFSVVLNADERTKGLDEIKFHDISFKNASYDTVLRFLFMDLHRMSHDENPNQIYNYIRWTSDDQFNVRITIKGQNISLKTLLDKICTQAKVKYKLEKNVILFGNSIRSDKNLKSLEPYNNIVIDHAEFEDCSLSTFFNYIQKRMNSKSKGNTQIIQKYIKKEIPKKKEDKTVKEKDDFFAEEDDDWNEDEDSSTLSLIVDNISVSTLISYVCRVANLEYIVDKNKITIKHTTKVTPLDQNSASRKSGK